MKVEHRDKVIIKLRKVTKALEEALKYVRTDRPTCNACRAILKNLEREKKIHVKIWGAYE